MPKRRGSCWPASNSVAALLALATLLLLSACADDRALIDRTLDARERALNTKNLDDYFALFSPDYLWAQSKDEYRAIMTKRFAHYLSVEYHPYSRQVDIDGDTARVVQEYRFTLIDRYHQTKSFNGTDHFQLKRSGFWPFRQWLFYQGLDAPAKPAATPAPGPAAPVPSPTPPVNSPHGGSP